MFLTLQPTCHTDPRSSFNYAQKQGDSLLVFAKTSAIQREKVVLFVGMC